MKLLAIIAFLFAGSVASAETISGDKIHFQQDSTWVSAYYNRTLCHDGETYMAMVTQCLEYGRGRGGDECTRWGKAAIYQPITSTRLRCAERRGRKNGCSVWERVEYTQPTTMTVKFEHERSGRVIREETITVPRCN